MHRVALGRHATVAAQHRVVNGERDADGAAGVAGSRLDPQALEGPFAQQAPVADAVERDAAREAEVLHAGLAVHVARHPQHDLLGHLLHGGREVHLALGERRLGPPRGPAEQLVEGPVGHGEPVQVVEVAHVELERPVVAHLDQAIEDALGVARLSVGREAHHLVLAGVDLEAGVVGERRVEHAERVRVVQLGQQAQVLAAPDAVRGGRPLADPVHGQHGRLGERRREERARGMRLVMLREEDLAAESLQLVQDQPPGEELVAQPHRHRGDELRQPAGRHAEILLEQPLELEQGLVVEADVVEVGGGESGRLEAVRDGVARESGVMLLAGEALLLRRGDDLTVAHQTGRRIVVEGGDAQDAGHQNCCR